MNPLHAWSLDKLAQEEMRALREHRIQDARDYRAEITRRLTPERPRCLAPASTATGAFQCSLAQSHIGNSQPTHRAYYQHDLTTYVLHEWRDRQSKSDLLAEMNARLDWSATQRALTPFDSIRKSPSITTHQAEEALRMSSSHVTPTRVITSVRLQPGTKDGRYVKTVDDLKRLIEEVERVGGSGESEWDFDRNSNAYTVEVVANTVTAPAPLTDAERVALLTEAIAIGTTEERVAEIKGLLNLA